MTSIIPIKENSSNATISIQGGFPLSGEVTVGGSKNSATKLMVAALLTKERCVLANVPDIEDVGVVTQMIRALGGTVTKMGTNKIAIESSELHTIAHTDLKVIAGKSRIPILFAGPLLHRLHEAMIPELGGCKIGKRPVDFHVVALEKLGAVSEDIEKGIHFRAEQLKGAVIELSYPSVGATEQILLASVLAQGTTEVRNAAVEPEIIDLISVLQKMGAVIAIETDRVIRVTGVAALHGFEHSVLPDRIEAASWACAAAATNGRIFVRGARQLDMVTFLNAYRQVGGIFEVREDGIEFSRGEVLRPFSLETNVHPGFMTDWQQPFVVLLTQVEGASIVHETVYEERFGYVSALQKMGAKVQLFTDCLGGVKCRFGVRNHLHSAIITGPTKLKGADITIPDLRAGFSYIIAALVAEGTSHIHNCELLKRGYENLFEKLTTLGARISY